MHLTDVAVAFDLAPWFGLAASAWLIAFQLLLAAGAPLGFLAWGGQEPGRLSPNRRLASLAVAALMAGFVILFGQVAGLWTALADLPRWPFFAGALLFSVSLVGNLASKSVAERWHGVPLTVVLAVSMVLTGLA